MRTPTPSVEHTSHIFSPSPLRFTRRASALSLMRLRSTRDCMRSASALKAATRRLSCTTWACSRLRRSAASGAWRMASMCWQVRTPGTGAPAPAAHSQLPCARFVATQRRQLDRHHHHHRRRGHRCLLRRRLLCFRLIDALSRAAVLPRVACGSPFRRRGAARRRPQRLRRRTSAAAIMGRLGQATCASQAALAALCRPPIVRALPLAAAEKKCAHERSFCAHSRLPERAQACL